MSFLFKNNKRRAFTFIELIIVILIISLVTTVAIASVNVIKRSARDKKVLSEIKEFQMALEAYKMIEGGYPDTEVIEGGGQIIGSNGSVFYNNIPSNIVYNYYQDVGRYSISFQLEGSLENLNSGHSCATDKEMINNPCCPSGLIAYLQAEENADDYLGVYNGVFTNAAYVDGKVGRAFSFNGSTSYINFNEAVPFDIGSTISAWLDFSLVTTIRYFIGDNSKSAGIRYDGGEFLVYNGSAGWTTVPWVKEDGIVHLVVVRVDEKNYDLYINGNKIGTSCAGNSGATILIDLVGRRRDAYYFKGLIDELMIFNKTLSDSEITDLYNYTKSCVIY